MFLIRFLTVSILLIGLSSPLLVLARRKRSDHTGRNFIISALVVAVLCGVLAESSARLVRQCFESGSPGCIDIGAAGFQALLIGVYLVAAWVMTYVIWRE
jgi:hypothetical protein